MKYFSYIMVYLLLFCASAKSEVIAVSIIQLISNPEKFHKKEVRIKGFVTLRFEGNAIFLHEEDSKHGLYKNGLWLEIPEKVLDSRDQLNGKYALVQGTFNAKDKGHLSLWGGAIGKITRMEPIDVK